MPKKYLLQNTDILGISPPQCVDPPMMVSPAVNLAWWFFDTPENKCNHMENTICEVLHPQ